MLCHILIASGKDWYERIFMTSIRSSVKNKKAVRLLAQLNCIPRYSYAVDGKVLNM